jgi:hypothetical protein
MRLIEPLKKLTLHKLHQTLLDFKLYKNRFGDVLELAKYAYSDEAALDRSKSGAMDKLRQLVVEYMVCNNDTIGKSKGFNGLLELGGEFVGDFWGTINKYVTVP